MPHCVAHKDECKGLNTLHRIQLRIANAGLLRKHQRIKIGSAHCWHCSQNSGLPADKPPYTLYRQQVLGIWNSQNNRVLLPQQQVMKSDWLLLSVDTSAFSVLCLEATVGCLYGRNKIQPATLQYVPALYQNILEYISFIYCQLPNRNSVILQIFVTFYLE